MIDGTTWQERLARFPRVALCPGPTALEPLPRLTRSVRANLPDAPAIWCKRDDRPGPAMGGNKARNLEFLMAEAQARNSKRVVTFGGLQSNHALITAAVARRIEMEPHLFYFEPRPRAMTGNLLLSSMLDARMHFIPLGGAGGGMSLEDTNRLVRWLARVMVGRSYFIPVGGHTALGCLGYVACAIELDAQARAVGMERATVVTAAGTGGTLAGLLVGFTLLNSPVRVLGIDVGKLWKGFAASIARLAGEICTLLGESRTWNAADIPLLADRYVGAAYGVPSAAGNAAIKQMAECEGIFLDPIYTGKAMGGLLDLVQQGYFERDRAVIFLHTGGTPGLFAFPGC